MTKLKTFNREHYPSVFRIIDAIIPHEEFTNFMEFATETLSKPDYVGGFCTITKKYISTNNTKIEESLDHVLLWYFIHKGYSKPLQYPCYWFSPYREDHPKRIQFLKDFEQDVYLKPQQYEKVTAI